uniref:helix-turn-helix domain-containing protein n=1 Tax=Agathobacter sp. TaxID=2021311 RepID=UPI004057AE90
MRKKTIDTIPILSNNIKMYLLSLSRSRSLPESLVKRAKIILLASQGISNQIISQKVGLHYNHVATWRNRFLQAIPFLQ